jgi:hypothetical protein
VGGISCFYGEAIMFRHASRPAYVADFDAAKLVLCESSQDSPKINIRTNPQKTSANSHVKPQPTLSYYPTTTSACMLVISNLLFLKQMEKSPGPNRGFLFAGSMEVESTAQFLILQYFTNNPF